MLGPEYWTALNHTVRFVVSGSTPEEAFQYLVEGLDDLCLHNDAGDTFELTDPILPKQHSSNRGFVLIEESSAEIADGIYATALKDGERPWLYQWAEGLKLNPNNYEMRVDALLNWPDPRIVDPDGPLGCIAAEPGTWVFFGFAPIEDDDPDEDWPQK